MGAPNIVRGGSHSGNIAAGDLVAAGLLDVLSSDYFPFSLIHATFIVGRGEGGIGLPRAVAMVTRQPGEASPASTIAARSPRASAPTSSMSASTSHVPVVRAVWRDGPCASCERRWPTAGRRAGRWSSSSGRAAPARIR